jgi:hypothetical protein
MSSENRHGPLSPVLRPSDEEAAIRRAAKATIAARYGFTDWTVAPDGALRDYVDFLRTRSQRR